MYGRNPDLLAHLLIAWQTGGDHVCVKTDFARHVGALTGEFDVMSPLYGLGSSMATNAF